MDTTQQSRTYLDLPTSRSRSDWGYAKPKTNLRRVAVDTTDGTVYAWDSVSETYSLHHDLSPAEEIEARRLAAAQE